MAMYSLIVLICFLSCVIGPLWFAISLGGEDSRETTTDRHFLRG